MADNENNTPVLPTVILDYFEGSALTNAQFGAYISDLLAAFGNDAATVFSEEIVPLMTQMHNDYSIFTEFNEYYPETEEIQKLDAYRDRLVRYFLSSWYRFLGFPEDSALFTNAKALKNALWFYRGLGNEKMTVQNSLVAGLIRSVDSDEANATALAAIGLDVVYGLLKTTQTALMAQYRLREFKKGERYVARGNRTSAELRKEICTELSNLVVKVNGAHSIQPTEMTTRIITALKGVILQFKDVAAANQGAAGSGENGGESGEDTPTPEEPTPEVDEGGDEGGDNAGGDTPTEG